MAYFGSTNDVVDYFSAAGVTIEEDYNPADFICKSAMCEYVNQLFVIVVLAYKKVHSVWHYGNRTRSVCI